MYPYPFVTEFWSSGEELLDYESVFRTMIPVVLANANDTDCIVFAVDAAWSHAHIPTMQAEYLSCEVCKYSLRYIELPF